MAHERSQRALFRAPLRLALRIAESLIEAVGSLALERRNDVQVQRDLRKGEPPVWSVFAAIF
jgi:hypothetical protein